MKALASNQKIVWFYQRLREGELELSADFQRNPVWQQPQKDYLIETIMRELPMPEVYIVNRIQPTGESKYIVVDGQQRLRTILEFVADNMEIQNPSDRFPKVKKFTDLSDEQKQRFWTYPVVVRDLEASSDDEVRDLFERLNKYAFVLNEQELRNARYKGRFLKAAEVLSDHPFWTQSGLFSANDIRRMLDREFVSILLSTLIGGIYNRRERLDEFYAMYEKEFEQETHYQERCTKIIETIDFLIPNIRRSRWSNKADFYTLFLSIDKAVRMPEFDMSKLTIQTKLMEFEGKVEEAKRMSAGEAEIMDYLDASSYASGDKEKRVRRSKILDDYLGLTAG